jgi:stress-induced morphogen
MTIQEMKQKLMQAFPDAALELEDLSGNGGKVQVEITSAAFNPLNRVQQHQAVMAVFQPELQSGELHALVIKTNKKN